MTDSNARDTAANEMAEHTQQWMREVTEEVARLTDETESDTHRREALEQRLADLEERIGSLLTLTELVSLNDNPFVEPAARDAAKAPVGASANEADPTGPSDDTPASAPTPPPTQAPTPAPTPEATAAPEPTPVAALASHPNDAHHDPHVHTARLHLDEDEPRDTHNGRQDTNGHAPASPPARRAERPSQQAPEHEVLLPDGTYSYHGRAERANDAPQASERAPEPVDPTQRRLVEVEWAALLARAGRQLDLGAFLGFYVEADWIDRPAAARVRSLTDQFVRHGVPTSEDWDLHDLHVRSIVLLGHGRDHPTSPPPVVDEVVRQTRAVANRRWIHPTA